MNIIQTDIPGVVIIEPRVFGDERGYFMESFSQAQFEREVCPTVFVQDNESCSRYGVLRGLHYQLPPRSQSKLVRVVEGRVVDFAVDIRVGSPTFGRYVAVELTGENHRQLFIPRGFAHGFVTLSQRAVFQYKCDEYYAPDHEGAVAWNDPTLAIDWRIPTADVVLSDHQLCGLYGCGQGRERRSVGGTHKCGRAGGARCARRAVWLPAASRIDRLRLRR